MSSICLICCDDLLGQNGGVACFVHFPTTIQPQISQRKGSKGMNMDIVLSMRKQQWIDCKRRSPRGFGTATLGKNDSQSMQLLMTTRMAKDQRNCANVRLRMCVRETSMKLMLLILLTLETGHRSKQKVPIRGHRRIGHSNLFIEFPKRFVRHQCPSITNNNKLLQ